MLFCPGKETGISPGCLCRLKEESCSSPEPEEVNYWGVSEAVIAANCAYVSFDANLLIREV